MRFLEPDRLNIFPKTIYGKETINISGAARILV